MSAAGAIQSLHDRCAVYTSASTAARLLDTIDWTPDVDLGSSVLLEPCVGEGALLLEAATRLLESFRRHGRPLDWRRLAPRVKGFELHGSTARTARRSLERILLDAGVCRRSSQRLSSAWVKQRDFLLERARRVSHIAANPPYVRWSKLPTLLAERYREALPFEATRGDLAVAFLDRMLAWSRAQSKVVVLTSDRWMFAQYAAAFRLRLEDQGVSVHVVDSRPRDPFVRKVGAYSAIVTLTRDIKSQGSGTGARSSARALRDKLATIYGTLGEAGCIVRVGPALGCGNTFIVDERETCEVEEQLLWPFIPRTAMGEESEPSKLQVVVPYDRHGSPIAPNKWPGFRKWARRHKERLKSRSHSKNGLPWWRTIDAIGTQWRVSPKLLLPEMCQTPAVRIDHTGGIPAHSLYAIWPGEWPIVTLQRVLNSGLLELTALAEAPTLKQNWFRFYKRFVVRTPLPKWSALSPSTKRSLESESKAEFSEAFTQLFSFEPDRLASGVVR